MSGYHGDYPANHTKICLYFDSFAAATGASSATSSFTASDVVLYKDGVATPRSSSSGITVTTSFDSHTGWQMIVIDASDNTDPGFYAAGHEYEAGVADVTIDAQTVRLWIGSFSIERAGGILALLKAGTAKVDVAKWLTTTVATPTVAGIPLVEANVDETALSTALTADLLAELALTGSAASAGATLASSDVDVFNLALDVLHESPITSFTDGTAVSDWGLRNYIPSRNGELREHAWKFALTRRQLFPNDFVLNGITATLTGAWAPFRLTEKWSGDLVTIRRSSDSTTDTFGLPTETNDSGETVFSDAILLDVDSISDFVSGGSGYFSGLFDQSGLGNHLVQATTTKQPLYEAEVGDNARPALSFDGTDDLISTAIAVSTLMSTAVGYAVIAGLIDAATLDSATSTSNHLLMGDASSKLGLYVRKGGTLYGINNDGSLDEATEHVPLLVPFVAELRHTGGIVYTRINGGDEESATSGDTSSLAGILNIGDLTGGSHALDFRMFAAMTFSSVPTLAERDRIVSRLMRWAAVPGYKDFGWDFRYPIPSDCIRMLPVREGGEFEGRIIAHEIEQGYILTDLGSPLYARFIQTFTDASRFDPLFVETLAARMAVKLAHWLTGKSNMVQIAIAAYNSAVERASLANSLESTPERAADDDVIDQRYDADLVRG